MMATPDGFMADYTALRETAGIVTSAHDVVWAEGADAVEFLDGLLSQNVAAIPVGATAPSLLLGPQGKLRATLWVLGGEHRVGLIADAGRGDEVAADLKRFKLRVDVSLELEPGPVKAVWGPAAGEALERAGLPVPQERGWIATSEAIVASVPFSRSGLPRFVTVGADSAVMAATGLRVVDSVAAMAVRIEAGEPVMGIDIDERTIPQEAGVVSASVDFAKGCYLGQELVARIESRGRVNRHLRGLRIEGAAPPPAGSDVVAGDRTIGSLTSVAASPSLALSVGLALLRREAEPGHQVDIRWDGGSASAEVSDLPVDSTL